MCKNFFVQKNFSFDYFFNSNKKLFFCEGCDRFCTYDHLELFIPKEKYIKKSKKLLNTTTNYVAMHIRRTDNKHSIKKSPLELFTAKIEEEIKNGYSIYIASDDIDLKKELTKQYGPSIIMQPLDCVNRNSHEGIEEAMIDMLCLAMSKKIYGSFGSTFSSVASYIYGAPLEILQI